MPKHIHIDVENLASRSTGEYKTKAKKLEDLIDVARRYAFQIR